MDDFALDTALESHRISARLPVDLETRFDLLKANAALWHVVFALLSLLVLAVGGLFADARDGLIVSALTWRCAVQIPVLIMGIGAAFLMKRMPGQIWIAGAVPITVNVAALMMLATISPTALVDRFVMMAGLAAFAANLALPVKFRAAIGMSMVNFVVYLGIPFAWEPISDVRQYGGILLFYSVMILITTGAIYKRERMQKQSFLISLTKERQTRQLMALVDELSRISYRDPLTGAGNRRSFDMRFTALWRTAAQRQEAIALILIDVDHFKLYNDAVGHSAGDECLQAVAGAIAHGARCPIEMVSRYGGEEFALVLQSTSGLIAESIRAHVEALKLPHPGLPPGGVVTVSVGKAIAYPERVACHQNDLIRAADRVLYTAKRLGRNRVVVEKKGVSGVA